MWWLLVILAVILLGAALWGPNMSNDEHPKYTLV
jgi:hypothetical protein